MATKPKPLVRRLLDHKSTWHKALVAVGAVAWAITAIAGLVALLVPLFRAPPEIGSPTTPAPAPAATRVETANAAGASPTTSDGGVTVIHTQTAAADALVRA
jgi:hypothetical protein